MYDLIIIGAGPAGLTAGIYAAREGSQVLILEKTAVGGQAVWSSLIENYPGFPSGISGRDLTAKMKEQAEKAGTRIISGQVTGLKKEGEHRFFISAGDIYEAKAVIVATGAQPKKIDVPGEKELIGRGVSYCATCDGPFFRNRTVAVIGGGNTAVHEALFLSRLAAKIFLVHRREALRASQALQEKLFAESRIEIILNSIVQEISGTDAVKSIRLQNLKNCAEKELPVDGIFVLVGTQPNTDFLPPEIKVDNHKYIITDETLETSMAGVFACGDCRQKVLRQVVTACAEGALAVSSAQKYLEKL
ncbi:MAG: thioredoxin-disulfide reductase [Candidatus Omnitrophota bacterium]